MTITHIPAARVYKYWATLSSAWNSCAIAAGPNQANLRLTRVYRLVYRLIFVALSLPLSLLTNSVCSQDVLEFSVYAPRVIPFRHSLPRSARLPCPGRQMGQTVEVGSILFCFVFFWGIIFETCNRATLRISLLWLSFASVCGTCKCKLQTKPTRVILKHNHGSSPPESRVEATKTTSEAEWWHTFTFCSAPEKKTRCSGESRCLNALFEVIKVRNRKHK